MPLQYSLGEHNGCDSTVGPENPKATNLLRSLLYIVGETEEFQYSSHFNAWRRPFVSHALCSKFVDVMKLSVQVSPQQMLCCAGPCEVPSCVPESISRTSLSLPLANAKALWRMVNVPLCARILKYLPA